MPSQPLETFLFDVDGTLIDSIELILASFRHTMTKRTGRVPPEHLWIATLGRPLWVQFRSFSDDEEEINAMTKTYREFNAAHHDRLMRRYPGVSDVVKHLKDEGKTLGVVTSKNRATAYRGLAHCGLEGLFDDMVAADDIDRHKPDPAPVLKALDNLAADPESTLFVGDSPHDIDAGKAAGVRTCAVEWGPFAPSQLEASGPTYQISLPSELLTLD